MRLVWLVFYRPIPFFIYRYRAQLLNLFGAIVDELVHPPNGAFSEYLRNSFMGK